MPKPPLNFAHYEGREQAFIKHVLLQQYLPAWAYKVATRWDSLVFVDCFAGPWGVKGEQFEDSSFGVAVEALSEVLESRRERGDTLFRVKLILVEKTPEGFARLEEYAAAHRRDGFEIEPYLGEFTEVIPTIQTSVSKTGRNPFQFYFIDPKGWSDYPMSKLKSLLNHRNCEVLVNLMTGDAIRFLDLPELESSYVSLFGRQGVLDDLRSVPKKDRNDMLVREYCRSLKQICGFPYVSSAVVLSPKREAVRYFLIYATHHHRGIEVFKGAESDAAKRQDTIATARKVLKTGQTSMMSGLFPDEPTTNVVNELRKRYLGRFRSKVLRLLKESDLKGLSYAEAFCAAMAYPLVERADLLGLLNDLEKEGVAELILEKDNARVPSCDRNDRIVVRSPDRLETFD